MKTKLLELGGNLWVKEDLERVYLNEDAIIKLLDLENENRMSKLTKFDRDCLKKSKTFYDVKSNSFKSDVGTVRSLFNNNAVECSK